MTKRLIGWPMAVATVAVVFSFGCARERPAETAHPYARTADGKPDLSGIWQAFTTAAWDIQDHQAQMGVPAGQGAVEGNEIPYQPWAAAKKQENFKNRATADPEIKCYLPGVPRANVRILEYECVDYLQQAAQKTVASR